MDNLGNQPAEIEQNSIWNSVTPLSKYSAMVLFVTIPFLGGLIGYHYAPEKVVEVERVTEAKEETEAQPELRKHIKLHVLQNGLVTKYIETKDFDNDTNRVGRNFYQFENKLFWMAPNYSSVEDTVIEIKNVDAETFASTTSPYHFVDKNYVYFHEYDWMGGYLDRFKLVALPGVDSEHFEITKINPTALFTFVVGDEKVFYKDFELNGVTPTEMTISDNGYVVYDTDTLWRATSYCTHSTWEEFNISELDSHLEQTKDWLGC